MLLGEMGCVKLGGMKAERPRVSEGRTPTGTYVTHRRYRTGGQQDELKRLTILVFL